jgi:hypothetical protein
MGRIRYLEAIGQKPKRGRPKIGPGPSKGDLVRLYVRGRLSIRDTAAALGISKDMTARALAEYGIARRPRTTKRGQLADIPVELLEANIRIEGLRGHARTLGVSAPTLFEHVRRTKAGTG